MSSNYLVWDGASDGVAAQAVGDWQTECELQDRQDFFLPLLVLQAWKILSRWGFPLTVSLHPLKIFLVFFPNFFFPVVRK